MDLFAQSQTEELYGKVCDGCPTNCSKCNFEEPELVPECISLSAVGVEHANSSGDLSTVEDLLIFKGYWRATNTSIDIKKCYNTDACPEGLTTGNCTTGYTGPCERPTHRSFSWLVCFNFEYEWYERRDTSVKSSRKGFRYQARLMLDTKYAVRFVERGYLLSASIPFPNILDGPNIYCDRLSRLL